MTVAGFTGTGSQLIPGGVQQMKRRIAVVALVFVAFALIAQQAFADSPHFIRASGSLNNDGSLTVDFKEAGLGTNQNITKEKPGCWTRRRAFTQVRRGSNIQLLSYSLVSALLFGQRESRGAERPAGRRSEV
jgi:hypothetical protein